MSPHPYTEDQLVEQPAIALLGELGWATVSALDEILGVEGTLGRETKSEGNADAPESGRSAGDGDAKKMVEAVLAELREITISKSA